MRQATLGWALCDAPLPPAPGRCTVEIGPASAPALCQMKPLPGPWGSMVVLGGVSPVPDPNPRGVDREHGWAVPSILDATPPPSRSGPKEGESRTRTEETAPPRQGGSEWGDPSFVRPLCAHDGMQIHASTKTYARWDAKTHSHRTDHPIYPTAPADPDPHGPANSNTCTRCTWTTGSTVTVDSRVLWQCNVAASTVSDTPSVSQVPPASDTHWYSSCGSSPQGRGRGNVTVTGSCRDRTGTSKPVAGSDSATVTASVTMGPERATTFRLTSTVLPCRAERDAFKREGGKVMVVRPTGVCDSSALRTRREAKWREGLR